MRCTGINARASRKHARVRDAETNCEAFSRRSNAIRFRAPVRQSFYQFENACASFTRLELVLRAFARQSEAKTRMARMLFVVPRTHSVGRDVPRGKEFDTDGRTQKEGRP
jgi:hypothetical protein